MAERERIFVQIASYRDPDCQWTIKDLYDYAATSRRRRRCSTAAVA